MRLSIDLIQADVLDGLKSLPSNSVHCVVTSPPYQGLRDYGVEGQIGQESTLEQFITRLVYVFREVRRVLHPSGTIWVNMGDSYNGTRTRGSYGDQSTKGYEPHGVIRAKSLPGLHSKNLVGQPWRVAFALQSDGWILRDAIVWEKGNPMPSSVIDRPTSCYEMLFLLSKSPRYYYDATAVRTDTHNLWNVWNIPTEPVRESHFACFPQRLVEPCVLAGTSQHGCCSRCLNPWKRIEIKEGTSYQEKWKSVRKRADCPGQETSASSVFRTGTIVGKRTIGWQPTCKCDAPTIPCTVLDPFIGSGTTAMVANRLGRQAIGIEINGKYINMAEARIRRSLTQPLFTRIGRTIVGASSDSVDLVGTQSHSD